MPAESSSSEDNLIQCYNKGCGQKFDPQANNTDSCLYHPGPPYFHDAYKIWNCCNKKSTDFGTWLNFPGCTRGKHNGEKPADIVKVAAVKEIRPEKVGVVQAAIGYGSKEGACDVEKEDS
ncbi:chord [Cooperia oncophora]